MTTTGTFTSPPDFSTFSPTVGPSLTCKVPNPLPVEDIDILNYITQLGDSASTFVYDDGLGGSNFPFFLAWVLSAWLGLFYPRIRILCDGLASGLVLFSVFRRLSSALTAVSSVTEMFRTRPLDALSALFGETPTTLERRARP